MLLSSASSERNISFTPETNLTKGIYERGPLQSSTTKANGDKLEPDDTAEGAYFWLGTFKVDESATGEAKLNITFTGLDENGATTTSKVQIVMNIKKSPYEVLIEKFKATDSQRVLRMDDLEDYNEFAFSFEVGKNVGILFTSTYSFSDYESYRQNQPKFAVKRTVDG